MNRNYYVYRFIKNNTIVYVGRTINLEQRFKQHSHLTDDITKIEYIICHSESEMIWKEIYYINLFYNNKSTNIKDVYDKPLDLNLNDKWIEYKYNIKNGNYIICCNNYTEEYFTGKYRKDGYPILTYNIEKAYRYSSLRSVFEIINKKNKMYDDLNYYPIGLNISPIERNSQYYYFKDIRMNNELKMLFYECSCNLDIINEKINELEKSINEINKMFETNSFENINYKIESFFYNKLIDEENYLKMIRVIKNKIENHDIKKDELIKTNKISGYYTMEYKKVYDLYMKFEEIYKNEMLKGK